MGCSHFRSAAKIAPAAEALVTDDTVPWSSGRTSEPSPTPSIRDLSVHSPDLTSRNSESGAWMIMGKYWINPGKQEIMGEGTSSICRRATCLATGEPVAVKVYKKNHRNSVRQEEVKMQKFKRQIAVLKELQEALEVPVDSRLWSEQLEHVKPSRLFMQLVDFSKDANGVPGPDPRDNILYVVTELAQYSLKDYLALRKDQGKLLPRESVRSITKAIILVMAGLHSKGLVHIDMKPENIMMFNGRLKLIDVDGCVKAGSSVSIKDSSISFSPCYCAPEWVRFLIEDSASCITISTALDVWSVGMTLCELVTLDAVLKPTYAQFLRNGRSNAEAGFLFMEWLSSITKAPLPKQVEKFDSEFVDLLVNWLLVFDPHVRKSCAQCLSHPYVLAATSEGRKSTKRSERSESESSFKQMESQLGVVDMATIKDQNKMEDNSNCAPVHKGALFKLDFGGDVHDPAQWRRRDMWIAHNASLCYFSIKDNKRVMLIEGSKLIGATVEPCQNAARQFAFSVRPRLDSSQSINNGPNISGESTQTAHYLACDSEEDFKVWTEKLRSVVNTDLITTMRLTPSVQNDFFRLRLKIKNRRMAINDADKDQFAPVFKGTLWKVKAEGDRKKLEDWFEREMWISKNGSLVYWSKIEGRQLVYYTADDLIEATIAEIPNADTCKPWAFTVKLPVREVEFAPGEFAAESEEMRTQWLKELAKCKPELT